MEIKAVKAKLNEIQDLRVLFLQENKFQFVYNKCHLYGWADTYLFTKDGIKTGYGAVWGQSKREDRDAIFEFYITEPYMKHAGAFFSALLAASGASHIECQTNDLLLSSMLFESAQNIQAEAILFEDHLTTGFSIPGITLQQNPAAGDSHPDDRPYILLQNGEVVATGGLMLNYNFPYADLYYEVNEAHRQKGFGSLLAQELKKEAYGMGRVPAARCNIQNMISKAALLKAGFRICGYLLNGRLTA